MTGAQDFVASHKMTEAYFNAPRGSATKGLVNKKTANHHEPTSQVPRTAVVCWCVWPPLATVTAVSCCITPRLRRPTIAWPWPRRREQRQRASAGGACAVLVHCPLLSLGCPVVLFSDLRSDPRPHAHAHDHDHAHAHGLQFNPALPQFVAAWFKVVGQAKLLIVV